MRFRRLIPVVLLMVVALVAASVPAGATAASFDDPADAPGPLDLKTVAHDDDAATITYTVTTYAAFRDQDVALCIWELDTKGDANPDVAVAAEWDSSVGALVGDVEDPDGTATAEAAVSRPAGNTLRVSVRRADVGDPTDYDYFVLCGSDVNGNGQPEDNELDDAPNGDGVYTHHVSAASTADRVTRLAADDRLGTAIEVSKTSFGDGAADSVVLARDNNYPDALAGGPLAAAKNGPLLLNPSAGLDQRVEAEIKRALPSGKTVYLLGGVSAQGQAVEDRLRNLGYQVVRFAGADRFETAIKVADQGLGNPSTLLLATGFNFPDALSGGAAAAKAGGAVLLTAGTSMPPQVRDYVNAHGSAKRIAIGGAAAGADPNAEAIVGADRFDTSRKVASRFFSSPASVGIASGANYPDALSGGARAAKLGVPLLLTAS